MRVAHLGVSRIRVDRDRFRKSLRGLLNVAGTATGISERTPDIRATRRKPGCRLESVYCIEEFAPFHQHLAKQHPYGQEIRSNLGRLAQQRLCIVQLDLLVQIYAGQVAHCIDVLRMFLQYSLERFNGGFEPGQPATASLHVPPAPCRHQARDTPGIPDPLPCLCRSPRAPDPASCAPAAAAAPS